MMNFKDEKAKFLKKQGICNFMIVSTMIQIAVVVLIYLICSNTKIEWLAKPIKSGVYVFVILGIYFVCALIKNWVEGDRNIQHGEEDEHEENEMEE